MTRYICIDGGTTNTRLYLVEDRKVIDSVKAAVGAATSGEGAVLLKAAVKEGIQTLLTRHSLDERAITRILASGMITSERGLYELPHTVAPAGIGDLHDGVCEVSLPEISAVPFVFLRGVKTVGDVANTDIMRGEETELQGIMALVGGGAGVYILPGSHSKVIFTDKDGRITDFFTAMTGEMLAALSQHTILAGSVQLQDGALDETALLEGYDCVCAEGLNKALFKVRISDTVFKKDRSALYSFFLGTVLGGEVQNVIKKAPAKVVIGGKRQFKEALGAIFAARTAVETVRLSDEVTDICVPLGAVAIYEYKGV